MSRKKNPTYPDRVQVTVVLNHDERQALKNYASTNGTTVSPFVRNLILDTIKTA